MATLPNSPKSSTLVDIKDPYWYDINDQEDVEDKNILETLPDDVPYLRRSIRNLRYHQPIDAKVLKATSGISVKQALQINEKKAILSIMDEVKNMLDYKVGHYIKYEDIPPTYKKNILRSFMFIKQKFFPNGDMDKLKA
jgi:hypothetical protein